MTLVLNIPVATPSLNQTHHCHWTAAFNLKRRWRKLIRDALYEAQALPLPEVAPAYAVVHVERFGRELDFDNFVGGLKPVIDALKEYRLIADDSPRHIKLVPQNISHRQRRTRITITQATAEAAHAST